MNIFEFATESPFTAFCVCFVIGQLILKMWHMFIRYLIIRKHGYPPPHCDGDGDFKKEIEL